MAGISLIERGARQMAEDDGVAWSALQADGQASYLDRAVSFIAAVRDPTMAMLQAGSGAASTVPILNTLRIAWSAMCDEAIAEHRRCALGQARSTENLIRNIIRGMDEKGAIGVSLDRAALEGMLDLSTAQINIEFIGGKNV